MAGLMRSIQRQRRQPDIAKLYGNRTKEPTAEPTGSAAGRRAPNRSGARRPPLGSVRTPLS